MIAATHVTAKTQYVEVDGAQFAYRRWGNLNSTLPPLLFLQHFRGGLDNWDPWVTDGLAAGREVILLNARGVASSTGKPRTRIEEMADDAAAVVRALGLTQIDLLGFSLGGFQALDLTRRHPDLVRKLMLLGTGPRGQQQENNPEIARRVFEHATRTVPVEDDFLFLFFGRSKSAIQAGHEFWQRRHLRQDQDPASSLEVMQAQIEANLYYLPKLNEYDSLAYLRDIHHPTFILNGVEDVMIPTINAYHMARNMPQAQLFIYPDAGHGAHFQYPERFVQHAIQFFEE